MRKRLALALLTMTGLMLTQQGSVMAAEETEVQVLDKLRIVGNPADVETTPGSAHVVTKEEIRQQSYDDVNRVLRRVPGVYVREEDGFGLFPNISLRGVDTSRSAKVSIMEDGILMAPAPYSAPSAYYSPTVGRMSGLEVLKGSSQIKYGPHITGGVINYLSTPIPTKETVYLKSMYGSFNELRTHAYVGNTVNTSAGRFGFLLEGYARKNDGFKQIDKTPDFRDSDNTGFTKTEPMIKLSWEPKTAMYQRLELKYGQTELDANETYLGLNEADFAANPTRRYAASRFDNIKAMQERSSLRYAVSPTDDLDIITTVYYNTFDRNWYKLHELRALPVSGNMSLSEALAGVDGDEGLDCLKGAGACTLRVRANNRSYKAKGVETVTYYRFGSEVRHELNFGVRYHMDEVRRFQWNDDYAQSSNGTISDRSQGALGGAGNRFQETDALALYVQDTIETGAWTFVPGIRYESLDQTSEDPKGTLQGAGGTKGRDGKNSFDLVAGGLGVSYQVNGSWTGFGGVHRGFSPPSPRGTRSGLDEETSLAFETGARYTNRKQALAAEAVLFYTQFEDLVVTDNIGGTGSGDDENFGEVDTYGLEFSAQVDPGIANQWKVRNPWFLALTYTKAEQQNDASSTTGGDDLSIFSFGKKGNEVPYVPEWVLSIGTGVETDQWGAFISGTYVDETFTSASNTSLQVNGNGDPDANFGKTDSYFVTDVTGFYRISEGVKLFGGVQNLFDEEYIVSRQPFGPRPGMPLFGYAGIEVKM